MRKEEAIEIAKNEAKLKGWSIESHVDAIKLKRRFFYWKDKWEVIATSSFSEENGIFSHTSFCISIDDMSGKVLSSTISTERFKHNTETIFPALVPVLTIFDKIVLASMVCLLVILYPLRVFLVLESPFRWLKEHFRPRVYCPVCKGELRTLNAKQCRHCFFDWH